MRGIIAWIWYNLQCYEFLRTEALLRKRKELHFRMYRKFFIEFNLKILKSFEYDKKSTDMKRLVMIRGREKKFLLY